MTKYNKFQSVVYQIYPRSFNDSNGDGIGDINGIIEKLDYLEKLGVDYIWSTPFFISPQNDNGYDVADYYSIDPLFGSMSDVETLIKEANKRNIKIMFDMVFNHTSTAHEWFLKALAGDKEYQEYYFFKDKDEIANWQSKFGGSAFEYVDHLDQYYLHLFDVTQADLNWENPAVFNELTHIIEFWLDKGVHGFRFDVINLVSKPDVFLDDDHGDGRRFYTDGPKIHEHLKRLNQQSFGKHENILTVGEMSSTSLEDGVLYASEERHELSMIFNFHHLKVDYKDNQKWNVQAFDFQMLKDTWIDWQLAMQEHQAYSAVFYNNHDQPRVNSRFGDDINYPFESATVFTTAIHMMRGMPYIYQGEEIGLPNAYFSSLEDYRDVESINMYHILMKQHQDHNKVINILQAHSRDNARTPIPWDNHQKNYGFTNGQPWIDFSKHPKLKSVQEDQNSKQSIFKYYQKLIAYRKSYPIISEGHINFIDIDHSELFVFERTYNNQTLLVITNHYGKDVQYTINPHGTILLSNVNRTSIKKELTLQPYEALVLLYED